MFTPARPGSSGVFHERSSRYTAAQLTSLGFTVSPDGQRFVVVVASTPAEPQRFTTLLNWTALLK